MNATDFITQSEYEQIKAMVDRQLVFEHERKVIVKGNWYKVRLNGRWHSSWTEKGKDEYHVFFGLDRCTKEDGWGGMGGQTPDYSTYDKLKEAINQQLQRYSDYDETEQISLF